MSVCVDAVCGLICSACNIYQASHGDIKAAEGLANWFKDMGWMDKDKTVEDFVAMGPHCTGCLGSRDTHWSNKCWILKCCVDDKGLDSCAKCEEFPCEKLVEWAAQNERYTAALKRLRELNAKLAE